MQVGPYETLEELARGGQGVVYRARDPRNGRQLALKLLLAVPRGAGARRFAREIRTLTRLDHPGVVRVYDSGEHQGLPYLCMELVEGEELAARIQRQGSLPLAEAVELAMQLADALEHAHERGVIHRDVKPSNVLICADGEAKLTDFGLVRELDGSLDASRLSKTGVFMGTPGYWSPEQAQGRVAEIGPPTDVYGLGATLYAMLTGSPPVEPGSLQEAIVASMRAPPPPSSRRREIPPGLDAVCARCLAPEPERRFARAADVAEALERALLPPTPRRPLGLAAALILLGGVAASGVVWSRGAQTPPSPPPVESPPSSPASSPPAAAWLPLPGPELPTEPRALFESAWRRALLSTRFEALEQRLQAAQTDAADDPALLALQGVCRIARSAPGGLELLDRARALAPWSSRVQRCHALAWNLFGATFRAQTAAQNAVDWAPDDPAAHLMRAILQPELEKTRRDLAQVDETPPSLALRYYRAITAVDMRRSALAAVTAEAPHLALPAFTTAVGYRTEDPARALELTERVLELTDASNLRLKSFELRATLLNDPASQARADALQRETLPARLDYALGLAERGERELARTFMASVLDSPDPAVRATRAAIELSRGIWLEAIFLASEALAQDSRQARALLTRARARVFLGDLRGARVDLERLAALGGGPEQALGQQLQDVLAPLTPPAHPEPEREPEALLARCDAADSQLVGTGDHGWALQVYEAVLAVDPGFARARAGRAATRVRLGYADAPVELRDALRAAPDDPDVLVHGIWAIPPSLASEATQQVDAMLQRFPSAASLRLASAYWRLYEDPQRAASDLQRAIDAGSARALRFRGEFLTYVQQGQRDGADLRRAIELDPDDASGWLAYGEWALLDAGRLELVREAVVRAGSLEPALTATQLLQTKLSLQAQDGAAGAAALAGARESGRCTSEWLQLRASACFLLGETEQGLESARRAVAFEPSLEARVALAGALLRADRRPEATALSHDLYECRELPAHQRPRVAGFVQEVARDRPPPRRTE